MTAKPNPSAKPTDVELVQQLHRALKAMVAAYSPRGETSALENARAVLARSRRRIDELEGEGGYE